MTVTFVIYLGADSGSWQSQKNVSLKDKRMVRELRLKRQALKLCFGMKKWQKTTSATTSSPVPLASHCLQHEDPMRGLTRMGSSFWPCKKMPAPKATKSQLNAHVLLPIHLLAGPCNHERHHLASACSRQKGMTPIRQSCALSFLP